MPQSIAQAETTGASHQQSEPAEWNERKFRTLIENSLDAISLLDAQGTILYKSPSVRRLFGFDPEEFTGHSAFEVIHPDDRGCVATAFDQLLQSPDKTLRVEFRHVHKDGSYRWVEGIASNMLADPAVRAIVFNYRDITDRKLSEEALRDSEGRLALLARATFEGIAITEKARFLDVNDQLARMLGYTPDQLIGKELAPLLAPEDRVRVLANIFSGHESHVEHQMLCKNGMRLIVEAHGQTIELGGRCVRITAIRDITRRKRGEEGLERQNRRLALLNEAASHLLSAEPPPGVLAGLQQRLDQFFQADVYVEFKAPEGATVLELEESWGLNDDTKRALARLPFGAGVCGTVAQHRCPILAGHIQSSDNPMVQALREVGIRAYACSPLLVGRHLLGTLAFGSRRRDTFDPQDVEFFQTLASYVALAKERVRLTRELRHYAQDLEQKVEERTADLRESNAELHHMSYSIIHDMRAPLRAMMGFSEIVLAEAASRLSDRGQDFLQRIMASARRMDLLITDALNYNKVVRNRLPLGAVDPGQILRNMLQTYPEFQPPCADILLQGLFPPVLGNEAGLTQCFSNLLNNAVKFVEPGQLPRVRIWAEPVDVERRSVGASERDAPEPERVPGAPTLHAPRSHASFLRLWFEDNGIGIPEDAQPRIFDMFQRVHGDAYEGTGIGLALVRKVTERMGGRVGVESEPGHGSRFWLELRRA